jgi:hypothetical protein
MRNKSLLAEIIIIEKTLCISQIYNRSFDSGRKVSQVIWDQAVKTVSLSFFPGGTGNFFTSGKVV